MITQKRALITGGAKRMGRAFTEALAADGYSVAIHYNSSSAEADALADSLRKGGTTAQAFGADLSDPAAGEALIREAAAAMGPLGVLVNSASVFETDVIETATPEAMARHFTVNTLAPAMLSKAFAAQAGPDDRALIFNVLDYKLFNLNPDFFSYTVSKYALRGATEMLARALAPRVRVNAVAPGLTLPSPYHTEAEFEAIRHQNPLNQGPTPVDMVRALRFYLETPSVSGQTILVDGGQHFDVLPRDVFYMKSND